MAELTKCGLPIAYVIEPIKVNDDECVCFYSGTNYKTFTVHELADLINKLQNTIKHISEINETMIKLNSK